MRSLALGLMLSALSVGVPVHAAGVDVCGPLTSDNTGLAGLPPSISIKFAEEILSKSPSEARQGLAESQKRAATDTNQNRARLNQWYVCLWQARVAEGDRPAPNFGKAPDARVVADKAAAAPAAQKKSNDLDFKSNHPSSAKPKPESKSSDLDFKPQSNRPLYAKEIPECLGVVQNEKTDRVELTNKCKPKRIWMAHCFIGSKRSDNCGGPKFATWIDGPTADMGGGVMGAVNTLDSTFSWPIDGATGFRAAACEHPYSPVNITWNATTKKLNGQCMLCQQWSRDGKNSCSKPGWN